MSNIEQWQQNSLTYKIEEVVQKIQDYYKSGDVRVRIVIDVKGDNVDVKCQEFNEWQPSFEEEDQKDKKPEKIEFPEQKIKRDVETPEMFTGMPGRAADVPTMVSINEAASVTGLSYNALRNMCLNNEIACLRVGAKWLINLDKLLAKLNGEV